MKKIILIFIFLAIVFAVSFLLDTSDVTNSGEGKAILIIDKGEGEEKVFEEEIEEGMTVFDFLKETGLDIKYEEYDFGVFIKSIDGLKNEKKGKSWLYYVNNEQPQKGSDQKPVFQGDEIKWKYEEPNW